MKFLGFMIILSLAFICTAESLCGMRSCAEGECCFAQGILKKCVKKPLEGNTCNKYCGCVEGLVCDPNDDGRGTCRKPEMK
ncbi:peptide 1-like [Parasteatoda tepidariorum]|uniref:peptide 1-like n=1 Tax=Parasteatoda tepidariorum TaxID=114398 RepID=UPI00077FA37B|nr:peptide 1-like [Parasteatoda tepidariorum]